MQNSKKHDMANLCSVQGLEIACSLSHGELVLLSALLDDVLDEGFASLVRAADQGTTGAVEEAHVERALSPEFELFGRNVFFDLHVALGRAHVLAESDNVDVDLTEFCADFVSIVFLVKLMRSSLTLKCIP
jgi:hypothetical protein